MGWVPIPVVVRWYESRVCDVRCVLVVMVVAMVLGPAVHAGANAGVVTRRPAVLSGAPLEESVPLVVEEEFLTIDCGGIRPQPHCTFEALYEVHNPTGETVEAVGAFFGILTVEATVTVDGVDAGVQLTAEETQRLASASLEGVQAQTPVGAMLAEMPDTGGEQAISMTGFELVVPAGGRCDLVTAGVLQLRRGTIEAVGMMLNGVNGRHPLLGSGPWGEYFYSLDYLISPIRTWAEVGPIHVTIRFPASWDFVGGATDETGYFDPESYRGMDDADWEVRREGRRRIATLTTDADAGPRLIARWYRPADLVYNGGLLVGLGGSRGVERGSDDFRMRFGYEIAAPAYVLYSVNVETDFRQRVQLIPMVVGSTPMLLWCLGFAGGVGVPVDLRGDAGVGFRGQIEVFVPLVQCLTLSWDVFPGLPAIDPERFRFTMMVRFGV